MTVNYQGEKYNVIGSDELANLQHTKAYLASKGYEPRHYILEREVAGTRKRPATVRALRVASKSDIFASVW